MATAANNSPSWYLFVYLLSSSALILSCCCEVSDLLLGGYGPIRSNEDRSAVAAAKFAVSEHNNKLHDHDDDATNKTSLEFVRIVDGSQQIVAGVNYKLVILAKDGSSSYNYYGVYLYDGCWKKFKTLYFFNRIMASVPDGRWWWLPQNLVMGWFEPKAPPLATFVGAYVPLDNRQDPTVVAAAKFAVAEWAKTSKKSSTSLEFVRVVDGEARVDENINYKLVILAKDNVNGSITYEYYEAVINVDRHFFLHHARGEFRTLESFNPIRSVPDQDISGATTLSSF